MEQKEYRIDYPVGEAPLLILPLCMGAAVLHGEFFRWFSSLDGGGDEKLVIFMRILYWSIVLGFGGLAARRLIWTIHATPMGLAYRFLGRTQKIIPWEEFSCASKGRAYQYRQEQIYLIPRADGELPDDQWVRYQYRTRNYWKVIRFHATKNNICAVETYLGKLLY